MTTETTDNSTATDTTATTSPGQEDFAGKMKSTLMSELGAPAGSASAEPAQDPPAGTEPVPTNADTHPNEAPVTAPEAGHDEKGLPQGVINQLAELRKERRELREKVRALEDQKPVAETNPDPAPQAGEESATAASPPIFQGETMEAIEQERRQLEDFEDLAEQNLALINHRPDAVERALRREGVELKDEDGHDDFTEDRMLDFLLNVRQNSRHRLKRELPAREQALKRSQQQRAELETQHAWLKDSASKEYQIANQLLQERADLFKGPNWLADLVEGVQFTLWKQGQAAPASTPPQTAQPAPATAPSARSASLQPAGDPLPGGTAPAPRTAEPDAATADLSKRLKAGDGAAAHDLLRRALGNVRLG